MSVVKQNPDEYSRLDLHSFCRGCLQKYDEPADLLQYSERNRRLFVYSTGIQVKNNDTLTFLICHECYVNMKMSCKFKKLCRSSDRRLKSFLRLKNVGECQDLATFLKNSEDNIKFPLSGNSTPVARKREDDNESTCTSIRNFMTEILQGEEMPDTEARIIKEVIEEEADVLDDSLDSHWLHDDDSDDDLNFSFSPYATPHSINRDHCYTPIKHIEPSLRCKNNHAKKVLLQLPTSRYVNDDPIQIVETHISSEQSQTNKNHIEQVDCRMDIACTNDDSIAELIKQNEDLLIRDGTETTVKSVHLNALEIEKEAKDHEHCVMKQYPVNDDLLHAMETESQVDKDIPLTENEIAIKSITLHSVRTNSDEHSYKLPVSETDMAVSSIDMNAFNIESQLRGDKYNLIETNEAVRSITISGFGMKSEDEVFSTENHVAVKKISLPVIETEEDDDKMDISVIESDLAVKSVTLRSSKSENLEDDNQGFMTETNLAVNSIIPMDRETVDNLEQSPVIEHDMVKHNTIGIDLIETETVQSLDCITPPKSEYQEDEKSNLIKIMFDEIEEINESHEQESKFTNLQDNKGVQIADSIDKNLEEALKNQSNKDFSLDDLLVSPTGVSTPKLSSPNNRVPVGISTPTINNILFGEKLDDESNDVNAEVDVLEEFFKEGVKDFDRNTMILDPAFPLHLKYDLQNAECKMCNKKFASCTALKQHLTKKHFIRFPRKKAVPKPVQCRVCGILIRDATNLSKHMKRHDKPDQEYKCATCNVTFSTEPRFKIHLKAHDSATLESAGVEPPPFMKFVCSQCGASFTRNSNLSAHMRRHSTDFKHMCQMCNIGFHRTAEFKIHNMRRHTGERPFKCSVCEAAFVAKNYLVNHMLTHADKPYECHYCGKKFVTKALIANHIHNSKLCMITRNKKKRERPVFACPYCPLVFSTKYTLVKHQNISSCWEFIKKKFEEAEPD